MANISEMEAVDMLAAAAEYHDNNIIDGPEMTKIMSTVAKKFHRFLTKEETQEMRAVRNTMEDLSKTYRERGFLMVAKKFEYRYKAANMMVGLFGCDTADLQNFMKIVNPDY